MIGKRIDRIAKVDIPLSQEVAAIGELQLNQMIDLLEAVDDATHRRVEPLTTGLSKLKAGLTPRASRYDR